jgi:hypothetical protein
MKLQGAMTDAKRDAAFERLDARLTELRGKIDEQLAALVTQGDELVRLLKEERAASAAMRARFMPPAHD